MSSNIKIRKNIIILFIRFLKRYSFYKIYEENLFEQKNIGIKNFLLNQNIYCFVANAFISFLKKKDLQEWFIRNTQQYNEETIKDICDLYYFIVKKFNPTRHRTNPLKYSFSWTYTKEGWDFWSAVSEDYEREIANNIGKRYSEII